MLEIAARHQCLVDDRALRCGRRADVGTPSPATAGSLSDGKSVSTFPDWLANDERLEVY